MWEVIDLSNNPNFAYLLAFSNSNLRFISLANGNNAGVLRNVEAQGSHDLICIQFDEGFDPDSLYIYDVEPGVVHASDCSTYLTTQEVSEKQDIKLYPNPTQDIVNIRSAYEILNVQVVDVQGKLLTTVFGTNQLDLQALPKGVYIVRVETSEGIFSEKIAKQ